MNHLVLLHGWGLHSGVWDDVVPALAQRFQVHALDLPGHGDSAAAPTTFEAAIDGMAERIPPQAIVCGWSLGGLLAQGLAARRPRSVGKLLLMATSPCFRRRPGWSAAMDDGTLEQFATGLRQDRDATLARFVRLNALHGAHSREAIRAFTRKLAERETPTLAGLETTLEWLREVDLRTQVARIEAQTVVLHGARDMLTPVAAGRWLAATVPAARMVEIPDAAHLPFFSHAEEFVRALSLLA